MSFLYQKTKQKRPKRLTNSIPLNAKSIIENQNIPLRTYHRKTNLLNNNKNYLQINNNLNFLENLNKTRKFIQIQHNIRLQTLEILLSLAPKNYFTPKDLTQIIQNKHYNLQFLIRKKYIKIAVNQKLKSKTIYQLSQKAINIVNLTYKLILNPNKITKPNNKKQTQNYLNILKTLNQLKIKI